MRPCETLTKRELEVMQLIAVGLSYPEIARKLGCALQTVSSHASRIRNKTGAENKVDVALYALRNGLAQL